MENPVVGEDKEGRRSGTPSSRSRIPSTGTSSPSWGRSTTRGSWPRLRSRASREESTCGCLPAEWIDGRFRIGSLGTRRTTTLLSPPRASASSRWRAARPPTSTTPTRPSASALPHPPTPTRATSASAPRGARPCPTPPSSNTSVPSSSRSILPWADMTLLPSSSAPTRASTRTSCTTPSSRSDFPCRTPLRWEERTAPASTFRPGRTFTTP
mmetsp:Transcript_35922/g.66180  ORF Transcript_35922/g.66180 Transcript_35922/m.66180 type:complete len:212 (-) Transcript_35922:1964-2599(-)